MNNKTNAPERDEIMDQTTDWLDDLLAATFNPETLTEEELRITPAQAESNRAAAQRDYAIAKLRAARPNSFMLVGLSSFVQGLARAARVSSPLVWGWLRITDWSDLSAATAGRWGRLAYRIGLSLEEMDLRLRLDWCDRVSPATRQLCEARYRRDKPVRNPMAWCDQMLREEEEKYTPAQFRQLNAIRNAARDVYRALEAEERRMAEEVG